LDQHREGEQLEAAGEEAVQRTVDGGYEIGAASHRFGQEHVDRLAADDAVGLGHEVVEPAAEAAPGHLPRGHAETAEDGGVDEVLSVVVGDEADRVAAGLELACGGGEGRGLAGTEEAADAAEADGIGHGLAGLTILQAARERPVRSDYPPKPGRDPSRCAMMLPFLDNLWREAL